MPRTTLRVRTLECPQLIAKTLETEKLMDYDVLLSKTVTSPAHMTLPNLSSINFNFIVGWLKLFFYIILQLFVWMLSCCLTTTQSFDNLKCLH